MCLIVWAWQAHPDYPLVLVANRDEFHARPTSPASFWPEAPQLLAGRDQLAGGTWLGVTRRQRFAALTNFRDPSQFQRVRRTRGELVTHFLQADTPPLHWLHDQLPHLDQYNDFNLLVAEGTQLYCLESRYARIQLVAPGIHGLSNHLLDTPWPKVESSRQWLANYLARLQPAHHTAAAPGGAGSMTEVLQHLIGLLHDPQPFPDDRLPHTGIPLERERLLSAPFILDPEYGTRCTTALLWRRDGTTGFMEERYEPSGARCGLSQFWI